MNYPPIKRPEQLWKGSKPNLAQVFSLGQTQGVDAVVMYWRPAVGFGYCTNRMPPYPIDVWVIDVKQRRTYKLNGREKNISALAEQALSRFLAGVQPKVVATAPTQHAEVKGQAGSSGGPFEGITLHPAPTTVAKAEPEIQKRTTFTPYKIAIFPFDSDDNCIGQSRPTDEKFASELGALITRSDSLTLAYSYYGKGLDHPAIKRPGRLWKGSKPNLAEVSSLGVARSVDAVVMYWRPVAGIGYCTGRMPPFPVDVYVIDVGQRKTYKLNGREQNISALAEQALSRFVAGRR